MPPRTVAHDGPVYERPFARPAWQDALQAAGPDALPRPATGDELRATLLQMVASPNLASKSWVTDQYDRYVLGNTVLAQPEDAGVIRVDEDTDLGVALATDGNGRFAKLDPYAGAQLALSEAYRNVAVSGARPLAVTDCLNFGSPEDPDVMWQFAEATRGLADACLELGVPVTGGNVSFYNQTGDVAINPTPVVGVLGVVDDVARRVPMGFAAPDEVVLLLGDDPRRARRLGVGARRARPPRRAAAAGRPRRRAGARPADGRRGRPGWSVRRTTCPTAGWPRPWSRWCSRHGVGATVSVEGDAFVALFSESVARAVVVGAGGPAGRAAGRRVVVRRAGDPLGHDRRGIPCCARGSRGRPRRAADRARGHAAGPVRLSEVSARSSRRAFRHALSGRREGPGPRSRASPCGLGGRDPVACAASAG